jgi:hypothetical protein
MTQDGGEKRPVLRLVVETPSDQLLGQLDLATSESREFPVQWKDMVLHTSRMIEQVVGVPPCSAVVPNQARYPRFHNLGGSNCPPGAVFIQPFSQVRRADIALCVSEAAARSQALVQAVLDLYWVHCNESLCLSTLKSAMATFMLLDLFTSLEDWFKFQTTTISAQILRQKELPKRPEWISMESVGSICGGRFHRLVRTYTGARMDRGLSARMVSFAAGILGLKRAALPLREILIQDSLKKHAAALARPMINPYESTIGFRIATCLERLIPQVLDTADWHSVFPSSSAHYGWSKKDKGAFGKVTAKMPEKDQLFGACQALVGFVNPKPGRGLPIPIYIPFYQTMLLEWILEESATESRDCDVHVVLEPMKARIITAGPPMRYHLSRCLQKQIHGAMRLHREFRLIGEPISAKILQENFRDMKGYQAKEWGYTSADYSAATDNIDSSYSTIALNFIWNELKINDDRLKSVYLDSMTGHRMHYPSDYHDGSEPLPEIDQTNGQLMGSPSSFPILCLINMAVLWAAWEFYCEQRRGYAPKYREMVSELRPLVNGDDLLFRRPDEFVPLWRNFVEAAGLQPSPGKNYDSHEFVVINSTFYLCEKEEKYIAPIYDGKRFWSGFHKYDVNFQLVPWVCAGLLKGQGRVLTDTRRGQTDDQIDIGSLASQLMVALWVGSEVPCEGWRERCQEIWFSNCREHLMNSDRSWGLPLLLGGLGLPFGGATRPQLVYANAIIKTGDWALAQQGRMKARGEKLEVTMAMMKLKDKIARAIGAIQLPEQLRPYYFVGSGPEARLTDMEEIDISVPSWSVPWTMGDLEQSRKPIDFSGLVERTCNWFKGGPAHMDLCLEYSKPIRCYGQGEVGLNWRAFAPRLIHNRDSFSEAFGDVICRQVLSEIRDDEDYSKKKRQRDDDHEELWGKGSLDLDSDIQEMLDEQKCHVAYLEYKNEEREIPPTTPLFPIPQAEERFVGRRDLLQADNGVRRFDFGYLNGRGLHD